jgi:hypothetical protein
MGVEMDKSSINEVVQQILGKQTQDLIGPRTSFFTEKSHFLFFCEGVYTDLQISTGPWHGDCDILNLSSPKTGAYVSCLVIFTEMKVRKIFSSIWQCSYFK